MDLNVIHLLDELSCELVDSPANMQTNELCSINGKEVNGGHLPKVMHNHSWNVEALPPSPLVHSLLCINPVS